MSKILSIMLILSSLLTVYAQAAETAQAITINGKSAQILFEIANDMFLTFPDDFTRENPNETIYQYICAFNVNKKGNKKMLLCEGPGGAISGQEAQALAAIGLEHKFKLTRDPGFDIGTIKGVSFFFEARCVKNKKEQSFNYSCQLQDRNTKK